jgi:hypothetical protein
MHVPFMRAGVLSMLALAGAVLPSACVRNDSTVFIRECMVVQHDTCVGPTPSASTQFWTSGLLDTRYRQRYDCFALVENQLVARGDPTKARTETSRIEFYEAEVQILTPDTATPANGYSVPKSQFSIPVTGFADPGTGADPGLGTVGINMIDAATAAALGKEAVANNTLVTVVASVVLHGKTLGGTEVQTNEFRYPLDICYGCLCDSSAVVAPETCAAPVSQPASDCELGQDVKYDCRLTRENCL